MEPAIETAATTWLGRRDRGFTPAERREFDRWLASDPRHVAAIDEIGGMWGKLDQLQNLAARTAGEPDPDLLARPTKRSSWRPVVNLATAAAIAVGLFFAWPRLPRPVTRQGEDRRLHLADGSMVELQPGARVEANFTFAERQVRLVAGEANFIVAKNPRRPFIVSAGNVRVRAVGTVFDVKLDASEVRVTVTEGKVQARHQGSDDPAGGPAGNDDEGLFVTPGHSAVLALAGGADLFDGQAVPAPATRVLVFNSQPLADVVAEFNRHNGRQMVVSDRRLAALRVGGRFQADNLDAFLRLIKLSFGVNSAIQSDGRIMLIKAN